jgi:pantetheine-phosphate adenylyltransferase
MTHVLCPGSFDPPTLGHVDVLAAAAGLFDRVTVAVVVNPAKSGLFSIAERLELLRDVTAPLGGVTVDSFEGLLVDYCTDCGIDAIVKGIRTAADAAYEQQMAQMNAHLTGVRTLFVPSAPEHAFVSSSLVKEVARLGGDVSGLLSPVVAQALADKLRGQRR